MESPKTMHKCLPLMHRIGQVFEQDREAFNAVWANTSLSKQAKKEKTKALAYWWM